MSANMMNGCDSDANFTGQAAAYQLANKLTLRRKIDVEVVLSPDIGRDWLDELVRRGQ
jgi:hypothetical protein